MILRQFFSFPRTTMNCSIIRPAAEVPRDFLISHSLCSFDPPQRHIMVTASLFCSSWRKQFNTWFANSPVLTDNICPTFFESKYPFVLAGIAGWATRTQVLEIDPRDWSLAGWSSGRGGQSSWGGRGSRGGLLWSCNDYLVDLHWLKFCCGMGLDSNPGRPKKFNHL